MKIFIEREVINSSGEYKVLKTQKEINFDVSSELFIKADLEQKFGNLPKPYVRSVIDFLNNEKIIDQSYDNINRMRIYSETYGEDYVFIFSDFKTKPIFFDVKRNSFIERGYWHKKSLEGLEINVDEFHNVITQ